MQVCRATDLRIIERAPLPVGAKKVCTMCNRLLDERTGFYLQRHNAGRPKYTARCKCCTNETNAVRRGRTLEEHHAYMAVQAWKMYWWDKGYMQCTRCHQPKLPERFSRRSDEQTYSRRAPSCKECYNEKARRRQHAKKGKVANELKLTINSIFK